MLLSFSETHTIFLFSVCSIAFLYIPGILATLLIWKSMNWGERIAVSPFLVVMGIVFIVRLFKTVGIELMAIPQVQVLAGLNVIIFVCAVLMIYFIRKQRKP